MSHNGHVQNLDAQQLEQAGAQMNEDSNLKAIAHAALDTFNPRQWTVWRDKVIMSLKRRAGITGCVLYWVIRADKPAGWDPANDAVNDQEKRIYQMQQNGHWYDTDNRTVAALLLEVCRPNNQAYTWLREYEDAGNGRGMWFNLIQIFDGSGKVNRRETQALATLRPNNLVYRGERNGGEMIELITRIKDAYTTLESQEGGGRVFPDRDKVKLLAGAIQTPGNPSMMMRNPRC